MKILGYIGGWKKTTKKENSIETKFFDIVSENEEEILAHNHEKDFWIKEIKEGDNCKLQGELSDVFEEEFLTEEDDPFPEELHGKVKPQIWRLESNLTEYLWQNQRIINLDALIVEYASKKYNLSLQEAERQLEAVVTYKEKKYQAEIEEAF